MKPDPHSPSQVRLALWDYIIRELNLPAPSKLLLLILANFTDPRSHRANSPLSLLVLKSGLRQAEVVRLLSHLEANQWVEQTRVPAEPGCPPLPLYHLCGPLIQLALCPRHP